MITRSDAGSVRVLSLNSPPANVLSLALIAALRAEVDAAASDSAVRALIITSEIPRYFCAGLDLAELTGLPEARRHEPFERMIDLYRALLRLPKPTVAAIPGSAILGGWIVAMACDFRVLSQDGKIALSEVRLGISPTSALIARLRAISSSPSLVKEMVLQGRTLRAEEAEAGGFVDALAEPEDLQSEALSLAKGLAKLAPHAYASVKRALTADLDSDQLWTRGMSEFRELFAHPLTKEGLDAMRDKRRPKWES